MKKLFACLMLSCVILSNYSMYRVTTKKEYGQHQKSHKECVKTDDWRAGQAYVRKPFKVRNYGLLMLGLLATTQVSALIGVQKERDFSQNFEPKIEKLRQIEVSEETLKLLNAALNDYLCNNVREANEMLRQSEPMRDDEVRCRRVDGCCCETLSVLSARLAHLKRDVDLLRTMNITGTPYCLGVVDHLDRFVTRCTPICAAPSVVGGR